MNSMTYPMSQGGLLRHARRELDLTVHDVAVRAGVTPSRISQVERAEVEGALQIDTLDRFAAALGYRLRYELVPADQHLSMLASEAVGGPYRVGPSAAAGSTSGIDAMIASGRAIPAARSLRELPLPKPLSDAQRAALGGRSVSELLVAEREADAR